MNIPKTHAEAQLLITEMEKQHEQSQLELSHAAEQIADMRLALQRKWPDDFTIDDVQHVTKALALTLDMADRMIRDSIKQKEGFMEERRLWMQAAGLLPQTDQQQADPPSHGATDAGPQSPEK